MFIDRARAQFIGGKGGNGVIKYDITQRPLGGDGGKGGDIILEGNENLHDMRAFRGVHKFKGKPGEHGGRNRSTGAGGKPTIIQVPVGTRVFEDTHFIGEIETHLQRITIVRGGRGGRGNSSFKAGGLKYRDKFTFGEEGEAKLIGLELRLRADVAFIGFPNAGKSSMLNALTDANAKIGHYSFTTIDPQIGVAKGGITLMDLPGLIEGTIKGKGVGTRFTKHAEQSRLVAHFIALDSEDLIGDYKKIRKELEEVSQILYELPEIIILTKADLFTAKEIQDRKKKLEKVNKKIVVTSIKDEQSIENAYTLIKQELPEREISVEQEEESI
jgi:GTP-binding protein